ncbi:ATP synthase F1 subunit gamma [bacterium]|nr:ATP synthase F1 subunit gamma [bacterium]
MASVKDIRRRISSVKSTQQITKAMKMVSAAKLRRAQDLITNARPFAEKIDQLSGRLMQDLASKTEGMKTEDAEHFLLSLHPLLRKATGENPKVALVVVSSDKGLCGAYNTNAFKYAWKRYQEIRQETDQPPELFFVGQKSFSNFRKREAKGHWYQEFWQGSFSRIKSNEVADQMIEDFKSGKFDRVEIVYTEFVSALTQNQTHRVILPMAINANELTQTSGAKDEQKEDDALPFLYKPGTKELLQRLLPAQVQTQLFRCFADSLASEFGSRMTSMDNATRNASDMIGKLTLQANRLRQASITTELTEIVSGAEALNG